MCDYQGYEFGAGRYPDSVCIDGRLFDADDCDEHGNLYDNEQDIPCPMCRPTEAVAYWAEKNGLSGDASKPEALEAAMLLVTDIRVNRGVFDQIEPPKNGD